MIACMQSLTEVLFRLIVADANGIRDGLGWDEDDGMGKCYRENLVPSFRSEFYDGGSDDLTILIIIKMQSNIPINEGFNFKSIYEKQPL
jgi:hypothetical protein